MKKNILELRDITFTYPGNSTPIFDKINFTCEYGQIGLIGENGCGKTTLFHIIVGLLKPDSGNILLNGIPIVSQKDFAMLRKKVGMVFQNADDQLFSPTVLEDIVFGPLNLGIPAEQAKETALETLKMMGMTGYEDKITHRLSGGEKRLIALATVIAMKPDILLLDEPTNDLDSKSRDRLLVILKDLKQTLLVISHDWDFLSKVTNTYYALEKGQLIRSNRIALHHHQHAHIVGDKPHIHS